MMDKGVLPSGQVRLRKTRFSDEQIRCLITNVQKHKDVLLSRCINSQMVKKKQALWQRIADMVTAQGEGTVREMDEVKKKWLDLSTRAKKDLLTRKTTTKSTSPSYIESPYSTSIIDIHQSMLDSLWGESAELTDDSCWGTLDMNQPSGSESSQEYGGTGAPGSTSVGTTGEATLQEVALDCLAHAASQSPGGSTGNAISTVAPTSTPNLGNITSKPRQRQRPGPYLNRSRLPSPAVRLRNRLSNLEAEKRELENARLVEETEKLRAETERNKAETELFMAQRDLVLLQKQKLEIEIKDMLEGRSSHNVNGFGNVN